MMTADNERNAVIGSIGKGSSMLLLKLLQAVKACKPGQMGNQAAISYSLLGVCSIL
jgi:hypothetical protein